jgi:hypothetical protein
VNQVETYDEGGLIIQTPDGVIITLDLEEDNARLEVE